MARAGMARWKAARKPAEGDEVQRSLELLDRVLSEFDDLENGNVGVLAPSSSTADDESPLLGGHQSEDDGYMSMNGRRAKFVLSFRPVPDESPVPHLPPAPEALPFRPTLEMADFPPPPEEAERIISTLLPKVSPGNSAMKGLPWSGGDFLTAMSLQGCRVTTATQTTLPKTRHQRPFGWDRDPSIISFHLENPSHPQVKFGSLPSSRYPPPWLPPRTVPGVVEKHREVRRRGSTPDDEDHANFSDDSLEQYPMPATKRSSIAWDVSLISSDALLTPGSTKVIGRRRRRSADHSSTSSIPPVSAEDSDSSATNVINVLSTVTPNGTYVVRKGRKWERKPVANDVFLQKVNVQQSQLNILKRCSSTFDNIKSLLKEGLLEGLDDDPPNFKPPTPPGLVRVASLPSLALTTYQCDDNQYCSKPGLHELAVTMEEEEDTHVCSVFPKYPCDVIEVDKLLQQPQGGLYHDKESEEEVGLEGDAWITASEVQHVEIEAESLLQGTDSSPLKDNFNVTVIVLEHEFPPLPPSPVDEDDDEYSEILHPSPDEMPQGKEPFYRSLEPPVSDVINHPCPPESPSSLKTCSMDACFSREHHIHSSGNRREIPSERRTLPSELPVRRTFQKRSVQSPREESLHTSCSLPETPIFARGCARTPHRRAPDIPSASRTAPRPGGLATGGYRRATTSAGHGSTVGLGSGGLGQALVGAELLRLAGGPGRGWYPRHRQHNRPASIEHLDCLGPGHSPGHTTPGGQWEGRKPLTLPPNLSPKFFHRSPREALRRVTSLLIRKGGSSKDSKREPLSPTTNASGEPPAEGRQKRGFFKSLWKRSRHYSLEHQ